MLDQPPLNSNRMLLNCYTRNPGDSWYVYYIINSTHLQDLRQVAGITSQTAHTYKTRDGSPVCVTHYITDSTSEMGHLYGQHITSPTAHTYKTRDGSPVCITHYITNSMHLQTRDGSPVCVTHYITNSTHLQDSRRVTGMRNTLHHQQHTPRQVTGMCNTLHHHLYTTPCCLQVFLSFPYQLTLITDTRTSHYTVLHYSYRVSNKRIA